MVWGLFPVDPLPGEESYYLFSKGTYKVGRKGCDIIVNKDKGVSRVHSEIIIDSMDDNYRKNKSSEIRIRDCSKYGTFVKGSHGSKEKVHEFPNKETKLQDSDLVSFGTGNATYRFNYVPLVFFICGLDLARSQEKISSIGACMTNKWSIKCTHILLDDTSSVNSDLVDAIISKKHFVSYKWIELLADKRIATEIPNCSSYPPTLTLEGTRVTVVDPETRENCLNGYTFLLESSEKYKVKKKLQQLLEAFGAKVTHVGEFSPRSQGLEDDENNQIVHVKSVGDVSEFSHSLTSIPKVTELNLICATLSGRLDPAVFVSPPVLVSSSCSTDETVVADSEPEVEITSADKPETIHKTESVENDNNFSNDYRNITTNDSDTVVKSEKDDVIITRECKVDEGEIGTSDIIFSQDLVVRDTNSLPSFLPSSTSNQVFNFKRFKKMATESGNGFYNLVPFSKHPYKGSEYENEGVAELVKEEKKRKQREAVSEDLFNKTKAKKPGAAGFVQGLLTRR